MLSHHSYSGSPKYFLDLWESENKCSFRKKIHHSALCKWFYGTWNLRMSRGLPAFFRQFWLHFRKNLRKNLEGRKESFSFKKNMYAKISHWTKMIYFWPLETSKFWKKVVSNLRQLFRFNSALPKKSQITVCFKLFLFLNCSKQAMQIKLKKKAIM